MGHSRRPPWLPAAGASPGTRAAECRSSPPTASPRICRAPCFGAPHPVGATPPMSCDMGAGFFFNSSASRRRRMRVMHRIHRNKIHCNSWHLIDVAPHEDCDIVRHRFTVPSVHTIFNALKADVVQTQPRLLQHLRMRHNENSLAEITRCCISHDELPSADACGRMAAVFCMLSRSRAGASHRISAHTTRIVGRN